MDLNEGFPCVIPLSTKIIQTIISIFEHEFDSISIDSSVSPEQVIRFHPLDFRHAFVKDVVVESFARTGNFARVLSFPDDYLFDTRSRQATSEVIIVKRTC